MESLKGPTKRLAEALVNLKKEHLPKHVWEKGGLSLLDTLGASFAGAAYASSPKLVVDAVKALGEGGHCTIIGHGQGYSAPWAALANGVSAHALDLDDSHRYATGYHPGATVIPACLAVAESQESSLEELRLAIIVGYEAAGRIGSAINPSHRYRGFHSTGTVGVFGAAAGAAKLLGLNAEQMAWALGIAGSMSGGVFEFLNGLTPTKHLHAGHAAMSGVLAATLASKGFAGPDTILEGNEGFCKAYSDEVQIDRITSNLAETFEMDSVYYKPYAACGHAFSAIDAALELRTRGLQLEMISGLKVETYRAAAVLNSQEPKTLHQGEFSIPFLVSLAIHYGSCSLIDVQRGLSDPLILNFARKVFVLEKDDLTSDFPRLRTAVLTAQLGDSQELFSQVDLPRGMPENPLSSNDLIQKFHDLTQKIIGSENAQKAESAIMNNKGVLKEILGLSSIR